MYENKLEFPGVGEGGAKQKPSVEGGYGSAHYKWCSMESNWEYSTPREQFTSLNRYEKKMYRNRPVRRVCFLIPAQL